MPVREGIIFLPISLEGRVRIKIWDSREDGKIELGI